MAQITYTRIKTLSNGVKVRNNLGAITHFGDHFAWGVFLDGCARSRQNGVDVTVVGETGMVLVGNVGQLDTPNAA